VTGPYTLVFDAGTGSGRAVIFDGAGREVAAEAREWWHRGDPAHPGAMDFDCEGNWAILTGCARAALARAGIAPSAIAALSSTSMREAFVLHGADGTELWACANVDARADAQVRRLRQTHPDLERRLYLASGQTYALGALPRLLWLREHRPDLLDRTAALTMLSDWILYRLSGALVSEPSNAGTTGLLRLSDRCVIPEALAPAGLGPEIVPPRVQSGEVVGRLSAQAAEACGLPAGIPVVAGGGDCQIGTLGLGLVEEGQAAILGGTFWQGVVNVATGLEDPSMRLRINPHVLPGLDQAEAISFFTGAVMRWCRDALGGGLDYAALEAAAVAVPPGAHGIIPVFSDVMRYGSWIHAAPSLLNLPLDPERGGPAAIFRALQENAAIVAARNLATVSALTGHRPEGLIFAGGAARSRGWAQILADVTGLPVATARVKEATALGCACAAATGIGTFASIAEAGLAWSAIEDRFEPDPSLRGLYDEAAARWEAAYSAQMALVRDGVTTAMWRAPGT
jgi:autoinducer 2 (AI-2) kinase